jgi:hypothetical protein
LTEQLVDPLLDDRLTFFVALLKLALQFFDHLTNPLQLVLDALQLGLAQLGADLELVLDDAGQLVAQTALLFRRRAAGPPLAELLRELLGLPLQLLVLLFQLLHVLTEFGPFRGPALTWRGWPEALAWAATRSARFPPGAARPFRRTLSLVQRLLQAGRQRIENHFAQPPRRLSPQALESLGKLGAPLGNQPQEGLKWRHRRARTAWRLHARHSGRTRAIGPARSRLGPRRRRGLRRRLVHSGAIGRGRRLKLLALTLSDDRCHAGKHEEDQ